jgi:hypothetical protein
MHQFLVAEHDSNGDSGHRSRQQVIRLWMTRVQRMKLMKYVGGMPELSSNEESVS